MRLKLITFCIKFIKHVKRVLGFKQFLIPYGFLFTILLVANPYLFIISLCCPYVCLILAFCFNTSFHFLASAFNKRTLFLPLKQATANPAISVKLLLNPAIYTYYKVIKFSYVIIRLIASHDLSIA